MDDLFSRLFGRSLLPFDGDYGKLRAWDWDFGVDDKDNEIIVKAEIPGFEANELHVQVNNSFLTIKADKKQKKEEEKSYRSYRRTVAVPRYNFGGRVLSGLATPHFVAKGTVLHCVAHYDNSAKNPHNPDPTQEMRWGDQTWEEMMISWTDFIYEREAE